jgi:hypothetical protein
LPRKKGVFREGKDIFIVMGENMMRISSFILMVTSLSVTSLFQGYNPRSKLTTKIHATVERPHEYLEEYDSANMAQVYIY